MTAPWLRIGLISMAVLLVAGDIRPGGFLPDTAFSASVGVTFSSRPLLLEGEPVDPDPIYESLLERPFTYLRLGAYWDEIAADGYAVLDAQMDAAAGAGKQVLLVVGAKAPRWPEFWLPSEMRQHGAEPFGIVGEHPLLRGAVLEHVTDVVMRYSDHPALFAWQVENEPLDPAGPSQWRIDAELLAAEIELVRLLDPGRPVALTFFLELPRSCPDPLDLDDCDLPRLLLGPPVDRADDLLPLLRPGDILGADVYPTIGTSEVTDDWTTYAARWSAAARRAGVRFWITELQAEPWETARTRATNGNAALVTPDRTDELVTDAAGRSGAEVVLLWGAEHWWRQRDAGPSWLEAADGWLGGAAP